MRLVLAFQTQDDPKTTIMEVTGMLPIQEDSFPIQITASCDGATIQIEGVIHLIVIDRGEVIPDFGKKPPEVELIAYLGDDKQAVIARTYSPSVGTNVPKVTGVTIKGHPFQIHNCRYVPLSAH